MRLVAFAPLRRTGYQGRPAVHRDAAHVPAADTGATRCAPGTRCARWSTASRHFAASRGGRGGARERLGDGRVRRARRGAARRPRHVLRPARPRRGTRRRRARALLARARARRAAPGLEALPRHATTSAPGSARGSRFLARWDHLPRLLPPPEELAGRRRRAGRGRVRRRHQPRRGSIVPPGHPWPATASRASTTSTSRSAARR